MCKYTMCLQRIKEGVGSPGTEVADGYILVVTVRITILSQNYNNLIFHRYQPNCIYLINGIKEDFQFQNKFLLLFGHLFL